MSEVQLATVLPGAKGFKEGNVNDTFRGQVLLADGSTRGAILKDLERDREQSPMLVRQHEMIVQAPPKNDPQVSSKQRENIKEALDALEAQADQEELRLRALATVDAIGEHVMQAEAA